jgi:hypothetical protein
VYRNDYERGVNDERQRCMAAACCYCAAAQGAGRLYDGSRVAAVRQRGRRFTHEVAPPLGGTREEECRASCLLTVHGPGW